MRLTAASHKTVSIAAIDFEVACAFFFIDGVVFITFIDEVAFIVFIGVAAFISVAFTHFIALCFEVACFTLACVVFICFIGVAVCRIAFAAFTEDFEELELDFEEPDPPPAFFAAFFECLFAAFSSMKGTLAVPP
jgi:hypothetical protein